VVAVYLSYDEALVLSDLLHRWYGNGVAQAEPTADRAEAQVLDDLRCSFDPVIDEVFASNYADIVEGARRRISPY